MAAVENIIGVQLLGQRTLEEIAAEGVPAEKEGMIQPIEAFPHVREHGDEEKVSGFAKLGDLSPVR